MKNFLILFLITFSISLFSQQAPPKREFRAVWVATVVNIDWPTNKNLTPAQERAEFITLLERQKANGMNAIMQQIRPACDALYPSDIEPWSEWLTGLQGTPPNPFYDPLQFQIDEVRKRNMELHAWFNPYRAKHSTSGPLHSSHVTNQHPEWIVNYGSYKWLDPGLPQVRDYVTGVIMDVVRRYDIDGVHFDDYFYPYPVAGQTFDDDATFAAYPNGFSDKDDWRRNNIDLLVKMVYDSIKAVKPWVKFGISPFGIWKNQSSDPEGSATSGFESYYGIYADSKKWMEEGWLDYMNPQIYWNIGFPPAAFDVLVNWWNDKAYGRHVYAGHAAYKINNGSQSQVWLEPDQMPKQIRMTRDLPDIYGSVFFSSKSVTNNPLGFQDSLRSHLYNYPSLVPEMNWIDSTPPLPPDSLKAAFSNQRATLTWNKPAAASDGDSARQFIIYRFEDTDNFDLSDPRKIRAITINDTTKFFDGMPIDTSVQYITYAVTTLDRMKNESAPAVVTTILITGVDEDAAVKNYELMQNYPNPFNPNTNLRFTISELGFVTLKIYDILGNEVAVLVNEEKAPGSYEVEFDGSGLSSGVYFYKLQVNNFISVKKMSLLK